MLLTVKSRVGEKKVEVGTKRQKLLSEERAY